MKITISIETQTLTQAQNRYFTHVLCIPQRCTESPVQHLVHSPIQTDMQTLMLLYIRCNVISLDDGLPDRVTIHDTEEGE